MAAMSWDVHGVGFEARSAPTAAEKYESQLG